MNDLQSRNHYRKTVLKVTMPSGEMICCDTAIRTILTVINKIGPEIVADCNLIASKLPFISKERLPSNHRLYREQKELSQGYWLISKISNRQKVSLIEQMADKLGLNIRPSLIDIKQ